MRLPRLARWGLHNPLDELPFDREQRGFVLAPRIVFIREIPSCDSRRPKQFAFAPEIEIQPRIFQRGKATESKSSFVFTTIPSALHTPFRLQTFQSTRGRGEVTNDRKLKSKRDAGYANAQPPRWQHARGKLRPGTARLACSEIVNANIE